jgi:Ca2+-binding EF-hand superfamily protein
MGATSSSTASHAPFSDGASSSLGSTLSAEECEELSVLTGLTPSEVVEEHTAFLVHADADRMLRLRGLLTMPWVEHSPVKDRLALSFGLSGGESAISFRQYILSLAKLSPAATEEERVEAAFALYDADGDGRISKDDMLVVLSRSVAFESGGSGHALDPLLFSGGEVAAAARKAGRGPKLHAAVDRAFQECSTHPAKMYISKEDFARVAKQVEGFTHRMNGLREK